MKPNPTGVAVALLALVLLAYICDFNTRWHENDRRILKVESCLMERGILDKPTWAE